MLRLEPENVQVGAQAASKEDAIRQVAGLLVRSGCIEPGYADSMLGRERVANTYLGQGIAIPHGLPKDRELIRRTGIAVLQVPGGVPWQQGETARLIVGIAAKSDEHIDVLSNLTDLLDDAELVQRLAVTTDPRDVIAALGASRGEASSIAPSKGPADFDRSVEAVVAGAHGLHARPATAFVDLARGFESEVIVRHGARTANGRSLAALLKLGVKAGGKLTISAQGADADAALDALKRLIEAEEEEEHVLAGPAHGWVPRQVGATVPGLAASPGLAIGPLRLLRRRKIVVERTAKDPGRERRRLRDAISTARAELQELYQDVEKKSGKSSAAIFRAHAEFLSDPDLIDRTEQRIAQGQSAGWSWQETIEAEAESLRTLDDPLLAGRATDLRDVGTRVLRHLAGVIEDEPALPHEPVILLADDLPPSDAAGLDPAYVLGFCTAGGGPTSHAAIIARSLGIPAVVGVGPSVMHQPEGARAVLDGDNGILYIDPSEEDLRGAQEAQRSIAGLRDVEHRTRYEPALTTDGVRIEVVANTGLSKEAAQAVEAGGEGIGLMRSEFLFLERDTPPSEEEQYEAYRQAVEALQGLPLILRTLDIGGDKAVPYLDLAPEENPFLGVRGIRLCLAHPELFRTQLRAIFRASAHGPIKIMYPMIATLADLRNALEITEQVRQELGAEKVELGIMIEVPSAVMMASELAEQVDFFSIGTNDLVQYVMAMDRGHPMLARQADGLHPAVLRMIDHTVRAATEKNRWVGVCGGMAGDPLGAVILIGLGVIELSVSIPSIAAIKARVRSVSMREAKELARRALACDSAEAVRRLVKGRETAAS
jgi:phosphoenolpyruvate-protein phosphotransferase